MTSRIALFAAVSAVTLLATGASAQTKPATNTTVEELIVTGTRAEPRSRLESLSPVDVVTSASLQRQGTTELASALAATVPSIRVPALGHHAPWRGASGAKGVADRRLVAQ